jgi:hypothetical protein
MADLVFVSITVVFFAAMALVGLGLALSRGLTEAMGGTLTPEETPGGGLTMVVSLPTAPAPDEHAALTEPGLRERAGDRAGAQGSPVLGQDLA